MSTPTRSRMSTFYITEHDHQKLRRLAVVGGFKSSSHLVTAILEPILQGDLSILAFTRSAKRLQTYMESHGTEFSINTSSLKELFLFPPAPPAIPDEPISVSQLRKDFEQVLEMIASEQRPNAKKPKQPTPSV